jgi:hypothetical protein
MKIFEQNGRNRMMGFYMLLQSGLIHEFEENTVFAV